MPMLLLHMRTLEAVIDGFLVTESTTCFQTVRSKQPVLSDAIAAGTFPPSLVKKTVLKVIDFKDGLRAGCKDMRRTETAKNGQRLFSGRCFQSVQRFALLDLLQSKAAADDLVFISDVDEIASPSLVEMLRECAPFPPFAKWQSEEAHVGFLHIAARLLKYGPHCDHGHTWGDGPRLYLAGWVLRQRRRGSARSFDPKSFDALRPMGSGKQLPMIARRGGWHLTSFGNVDDLTHKLTTFGAANKFGMHADALDPVRLEACRRQCTELLVDLPQNWKPPPERPGQLVPTPCHHSTRNATRLQRRAVLKHRRHSVRGLIKDGAPLTSAVLKHAFANEELMPPYLLDHPEEFPSAWFDGLRSVVPDWVPVAEPLARVVKNMQLWKCAAPPQQPQPPPQPPPPQGPLPAVLLYLLGELGVTMGQGLFEFVTDGDVGDVYVLTDEGPFTPPHLSGGLKRRACAALREVEFTDLPKTASGGHYSGRWCMQKLELLSHLPAEVTTAVLLDADVFLMRDGMRIFRDHLSRLSPEQFVLAPRTDARVLRRSRNGTRFLGIPHRSEGINSGVLAINAPRMRAFAKRFCPEHSSWWRCILAEQPKGYNHVGGDQAFWNALLVDKPHVWKQLPCWTQLSIDALRGAVVRVAGDVGCRVCEPRPADGAAVLRPAEVVQKLLGAAASGFDGCGVGAAEAGAPSGGLGGGSIEVDDPRFGPVPAPHGQWPSGVAVTHGAARLQPLARLVAALLSAPSDEERRRLFGLFPCWCYGYIKSDGEAAFGALPGTPKGDTGCHRLRFDGVPPLPGAVTAATAIAAPSTPATPRELRAADSDVIDADAAPSFAASDVGCGGASASSSPSPPPKAAFCFTGHPRTFLHPEARKSITTAIRAFGADAYTFFVLTDDDGGSSWSHPPIPADDATVKGAMAELHPKHASYGRLNVPRTYAAERRAACGLPPEGLTRAIGGRPFMRTFYETHHKLSACFDAVAAYEAQHSLTFDWVVRMRPDVWFFGELPRHCSLAPGRISFPVGVIGCGYSPCINDHMAFTPRALSRSYFKIVHDMESCEGLRRLSSHWKNYNLWRLMDQKIPLAEPSPLIPYTLLRPCGNSSADSFYPECHRWTSKPLEKNAGLSYYSNGSSLPHLAEYKANRIQVHQACRERARATFPAFAAVDGNGAFDMARLKRCQSPGPRTTAAAKPKDLRKRPAHG